MRNLLIVESPTKIKTIKKFLSKDDDVISTKGHLFNLAKKPGRNWLGIKIDENFEPIYEVDKGKEKIINQIKAKTKKAHTVLVATDPDREGEAIAHSIRNIVDVEHSKIKRIRFNEITKNAILKALENPSEIDENLVMAQQARRVLDRILGFKLSSLLKTKIGSRSAGRVQSVALMLIVKREMERKAFIPVKHFLIDLILKNGLKVSYYGTNNAEKLLVDEDTKNAIVEEINKKGIFLDDIIHKKIFMSPPKPLKTSTLIQKASLHFGYSAAQTMLFAQHLYEGIEIDGGAVGLITYMRTDSTNISKESEKMMKDYLLQKGYHVNNELKKDAVKGKFEQAAHEAIRPTNSYLTSEQLISLDKKQQNLYKLIWYYAHASLMNPAEVNSVKFLFSAKGHLFISRMKTIKNEGYLHLMKQFREEKDLYSTKYNQHYIDNMKPNMLYEIESIEVREQETKPPKRYSTASLVKQLEKLGVGRPSTYSSIIRTLKKRYYINEENKSFIPTEQGIKTAEILEKHFSAIINNDYTANMEKNFDKVAKGESTYLKTIQDFYEQFDQLMIKAKKNIVKQPPKKTGEMCPKCGMPLVERLGRFGKFIGCSNYPKCKYIKSTKLEEVGKCPECNGVLVERKSRRGSFIGCSNYPKCKYIYSPNSERSKKES